MPYILFAWISALKKVSGMIYYQLKY